MQSATLIIGWYAAKLPLPSSLLPGGKVPRRSHCRLLTTATLSPTRRKPYSTSSTASLMQPRTWASPSVWRRHTKVFCRLLPREACSPPHISIDGTSANAIKYFTYLGNVISSESDLDKRLSKASSSVVRLSKTVWQSRSPRLSTKIQVHRAVVVSTLLYGAETWLLYLKQIRPLERFH